MHHSFAWCFFFYLSFLFPPVEPGVFNCCETIKQDISDKEISCFYLYLNNRYHLFTLSPILLSIFTKLFANGRRYGTD